MRTDLRTRGVVGFCICAAICAVVGTTHHQFQQAQQAVQPVAYSQNTKLKLLSFSEPLVRILLPGTPHLETTTYLNTFFNGAGQTVHSMCIDYSDPASGDTAHLLWNADTGELVRATRFRPHEKSGGFSENSSEHAAVGLAWDWFRAMKIEHPSEEWHVVGTHKKPYTQWDVYLRCGDRTAIVTVNTGSGKLVQAMCNRLPDAKVAWAPREMGTQS